MVSECYQQFIQKMMYIRRLFLMAVEEYKDVKWNLGWLTLDAVEDVNELFNSKFMDDDNV